MDNYRDRVSITRRREDMKRPLVLLLPFALVLLFGGASLYAQEDVKARIDAMERELQSLKASLTKQEERADKDQTLITELKEKNELQAKKMEDISQVNNILIKDLYNLMPIFLELQIQTGLLGFQYIN